MIRVALLSDTHANASALRAVLSEVESLGCERVLCCGDVVGLGPEPNEVIDALRAVKAMTVVGNVDRNVLRVLKRQERYRKSGKLEKWVSYGWTWNVLTQENRFWLAQLEQHARCRVGGKRVYITHGLPGNLDGQLTAICARDKGRKLLRKAACDVMVVGHSHSTVVHSTGHGVLVNCGSVGLSFDEPGVACWVLAEFGRDEEPKLRVCNTPYDLDATLAAFDRAKLPPQLKGMFANARPASDKDRQELASLANSEDFVARGTGDAFGGGSSAGDASAGDAPA